MRAILAAALLSTSTQAARVYYVNQPELQAAQIVAVNPDGTNSTTLWASPQVTDLRGLEDGVANVLRPERVAECFLSATTYASEGQSRLLYREFNSPATNRG